MIKVKTFYQTVQFGELEKQEQIKPEMSGRKEVVNYWGINIQIRAKNIKCQ